VEESLGVRNDRGNPAPYGWALVATATVALVYIVTLAPTTAFWDTGEYIATAHILGLPHPPGNPLFVVLARAWDLLLAPLGLSVAVKINLFSTTMSALAHGFWFLVVHHILRHFTEDRVFPLVGAFVAVLVSATAFTVWNQSNVNEKVYTFSLFTIALLSWLAFQWREKLGKGRNDNPLILMVFILALSVGNHLMAFLVMPALGLFVLLVHPRTLLNWKLYLAAIVATFLGLSIHLYLPLRAALDPVINEVGPGCDSLGDALVSIVSWGQGGCEALSDALMRRSYRKPPLMPRLAPLHLQFVNYLQYFDWQWARVVEGTQTVFAAARLPFTVLFTGLGIYGALEHFRKDRVSWWYVLTLFGTLSVALIFYLNFKYGYSIEDPLGDLSAHEVRERDYFFIVSFSVWGLWAGIGIASLWLMLGRRVKWGYRKAAPVLLIAVIPLVLNWPSASRAGDYSARDWAYNLLMSVEPYGVLFTNGDNDTFPLWYLQEVEGIRRDVTVVAYSALRHDWQVRNLARLTTPCPPGKEPGSDPTRALCQRPYRQDGPEGAAYGDAREAEVIRGVGKVPILLRGPVVAPTRSILALDSATIDRIALTRTPLREDRAVDLGFGITARLRAGTYIEPWHQFALAIISASLGDRPLYFAASWSGADQLGLRPYVVRQGLAFKINAGPLDSESGEGIIGLPSSPYTGITGLWLDVDRTQTLVWDVFIHRGGLPEGWDSWPDRAVRGIPSYYSWAHFALQEWATQSNLDEEVRRNREKAEAWAVLSH
jgi:hypothetical protein